MVLAYHRIEHAEADVRRMLGARPYGTPSFAVQRLAIPHITVEYREWSNQELLALLDRGAPLIIFVRTGFLDYWETDVAHAIIVTGAEAPNFYWVHDPAQPVAPIATAWHGLLAAWSEFTYKGALLSRTP